MADGLTGIQGIQEISVALRKVLDREKALKAQFLHREERHREVGA